MSNTNTRTTPTRPTTAEVLRGSSALATTTPAPLASPGDFGTEHMRIVREAFAPTATQPEFDVLWAGAKARGLDPVRRQIHFVKRNEKQGDKWIEKWSSQVSIDGFRSIAEATGKYDGQDEAEYLLDADGYVLAATVRVYRKDISRPFVATARWPEFVQLKDNKPTHMWAKMPFHMLSKCAEALALRKAFPEKLAGLYAPEEMGGASEEMAQPHMITVAPIVEHVPAGETPRAPGEDG